MNFEELQLAPAILKAVREQGYESPTPIQAQAIPAIMQGRDVLGGAQTGTGKTAAFTLPLLHLLTMSRSAVSRFNGLGIRALVLTPTRELAAQVQESVVTYGQYLQLTSTVVFGGVGANPQIKQLRQGVDILVATPGRLLDLQQQGAVDLSQVQVLVLDEADRMLDMGFIHDVKKVLALLPSQKQSLLFSATFSDEIRDLANSLLREPLQIQVTPRNTTVERIAQVVITVGRAKKKALLAHLIEQNNWSQVLVFTRTKFGANHVAEALAKSGITAMALHGNKSQSARTQALEGFKNGDIRVLVATDIAARGIDIDELPHVVNYDIPNVTEDYVHRIGRTGRAGSTGEAVNLVCLDEQGFMQEIEQFTKQSIPCKIIEGFEPDADERAEPIAMGRQTLWGGLGKPPSRDVMMAAAKAARSEMLQRVREKNQGKPTRGPAGGSLRTPYQTRGPVQQNSAPAAVLLDSNGEAMAPRAPRQAREGREGRDGRPYEPRTPRGIYGEARRAGLRRNTGPRVNNTNPNAAGSAGFNGGDQAPSEQFHGSAYAAHAANNPSHEARPDYRNDNRQDNRTDNRPEFRHDNRIDNRGDTRSDNRNDNRNDNRMDHRGDHRMDNRQDARPSFAGNRPAGRFNNQRPENNRQGFGQSQFTGRRPPEARDDDYQPRHINHNPGLGLNTKARHVPAKRAIDGQPNPLRTTWFTHGWWQHELCSTFTTQRW
jgi:ATP-dependent RNA helicase RhlE